MKAQNRRHFLKATGVTLGLPILESLVPRAFAAEALARVSRPGPATGIRRMVAICSPLGIHTPNLFPAETGFDYKPTPYLQTLQEHRKSFTVISGLLHPDVDGGHPAEQSFLTAAPHPGAPSFRNTISVDQFAAEQIGHHTRFPSIPLSATATGLSHTRSGVRIPPEKDPARLFGKLFLEGTAAEKDKALRRIEDGQSVLDLVGSQLKEVQRNVGREEVQTLDQYFSGVRELEQRMAANAEWATKPKPVIEEKPPGEVEDRSDFVARMGIMYDLMFLAIRTDSTRLMTFLGAGGAEVVPLKGIDEGWHNLSHHGKDPGKLEQLAIIEKAEMKIFSDFLTKFKSVKEGENTLLDQTAVILGSNLGDASSHNNTNLPIIFAGGRFKHGQHLAFDPEKSVPLSNLFVNCLQHLGLEADSFASSEGALKGV